MLAGVGPIDRVIDRRGPVSALASISESSGRLCRKKGTIPRHGSKLIRELIDRFFKQTDITAEFIDDKARSMTDRLHQAVDRSVSEANVPTPIDITDQDDRA